MNAATSGAQRGKLLNQFRLRALAFILSVAVLLFGLGANRSLRRARAVALFGQWGLCARESGASDFDDLPWSMLPNLVCNHLAPWCPKYDGVELKSEFAAKVAFESQSNRPAKTPPEPSPAERKRAVAAIATLTELEYAQTTWQLDDEDLGVLCSLENLEAIELNISRLTGAGLANLQKLQKLKFVVLDFDRSACLALKTTAVFSQLPHLETLELKGPLPRETLARLKTALPGVSVESE